MKYQIEWENQNQGECDTIAQGLQVIADAEDAGEIHGAWAGVRALDGSGIVADVHLHPCPNSPTGSGGTFEHEANETYHA